MPALPRRVAVATTLLLTLGAAPALADTTQTDGSAPFSGATRTGQPSQPGRILPQEVHGRAAVRALGPKITAVAMRNGLTPARLEQVLTTDPTAWISETGQMFYRDELPTGEEASGSGTGAALAAAYPTSQTFTLHSRPGATKQIYLDFNGVDLLNSAWSRMPKNPIQAGTYSGYDSDGDVNAYGAAEHAWIQEVWRQVAETYAPFDVDVTTADGGAGARTRSMPNDTTFGTQVVFTNAASAVQQACASQCLGIAFVGTFGDVDPAGALQPAFVFTSTTMSPTIAAQGAAHEAGHTLGLTHDGTTDGTNTQAYFAGNRLWGPVMGSATFRGISQFSKGEYANANNAEDDFAVIQAQGLPLRVDDHGNTTATADQLGAKASYAVDGVISTRSDGDVFAIDVQCPTDLTVTAQGIGAQAAVDLKLDVLNGSGATVASNAPASTYTGSGSKLVVSGMNATAKVSGALGRYYLRVDGVGVGDPKTTGYSDYGSVGQYKLSSNGCITRAAEPPPSGQGSQNPPPVVTRPSPPRIGTASSGANGGAISAVARWYAPTSNGGAPITKYRVLARRLDANGRTVVTYTSAFQGPSVRKLSMTLPKKARYRFQVVAWNRVGASTYSGISGVVNAR